MLIDNIAWNQLAVLALETFSVFWFTIIVLRFISARVFSQTSPEYLLFLLLLVSGMYGGISHRNNSLLGSFVIGVTLLFTVIIINRFDFLRTLITGKPVILVAKGKLNREAMKRTLIEVDDLDKMAREYGLSSYKMFDDIVLETSGKLTGVIDLNKSCRPRLANKEH